MTAVERAIATLAEWSGARVTVSLRRDGTFEAMTVGGRTYVGRGATVLEAVEAALVSASYPMGWDG